MLDSIWKRKCQLVGSRGMKKNKKVCANCAQWHRDLGHSLDAYSIGRGWINNVGEGYCSILKRHGLRDTDTCSDFSEK